MASGLFSFVEAFAKKCFIEEDFCSYILLVHQSIYE